jgi:hypothetical protein
MSRFIIVSVPGAAASPSRHYADSVTDDSAEVEAGCAWLFSAAPRVDDPEEAVRAAVREYFASAEGTRVREGEGMERVGWCEAIRWVPDATWERHGLTVFRHPDVERIILHDEEDLAEELTGSGGRGSPQLVARPPSP